MGLPNPVPFVFRGDTLVGDFGFLFKFLRVIDSATVVVLLWMEELELREEEGDTNAETIDDGNDGE